MSERNSIFSTVGKSFCVISSKVTNSAKKGLNAA